MKKFKEIVVVSGKGGTGKTTFTATLAASLPRKIIADTDVDAANLHILLQPKKSRATKFRGKDIASLDPGKCTNCGLCREKCAFDAVIPVKGNLKIDESACEGCTLCSLVCPTEAIVMIPRFVGDWMISETAYGKFVHARLKPGGENSGHLVTMVRLQAKHLAVENNIDTILIDGPPGIGCPVNAAVSGTNYAVVVTEPTYSGISDLERILLLIRHFGIPCGVIVNRFDIHAENTNRIERYCREAGASVLAKIPHSYEIMESIAAARIPINVCQELDRAVSAISQIISDI